MSDLHIFVTGIVGRAMGSGKFSAEDINELTRNAISAYHALLAPHAAQTTTPPRPSPSASQGPQKPDWQRAAVAVSGGAVDIPPETKSFSMWGGDKAGLWGDGSDEFKALPWHELLERAREGNRMARAALEKEAAKTTLGKDPKWHDANARRIARAKACLNQLKERAEPEPSPSYGDEPPF